VINPAEELVTPFANTIAGAHFGYAAFQSIEEVRLLLYGAKQRLDHFRL